MLQVDYAKTRGLEVGGYDLVTHAPPDPAWAATIDETSDLI